ncbi:DUF3024 domain-containing protein [Pedobacter nyackensis]|uniref:DUF3024 domain-containing protein n=1 Tax=Pedobacter nyackensis TaxID=475255 RepID=A0A1W2DSJ5_9SPHI|nr:DUF3024 domain-containing protein [Pedobacter nyackensis]SMD00383.1 Protein of unknown function [Pedobacter nyackensis]
MAEVQLSSFIESLRPSDEDVRKQLDYGYSWDGQAAILFEIRPQWNDSSKTLKVEFAKLRYVKSNKTWKLYWLRGSRKWEAYEPLPESTNLQELLTDIKNDEYACFFG